MSKIDLGKYGIKDVKEIVYNPSYELLFEEEMKKERKIFADATNVDCGSKKNNLLMEKISVSV